jgi:hypothetical protein
MQDKHTSVNKTNATPRRKNQHHNNEDVKMQEDEGQVTPASHKS